MQTLESLKRKIDSTEDLQSVVKTMKALAAVNIREYERAAESLEEYQKTIEIGLQIVLRQHPELVQQAQSVAIDRVGVVIFGSDQGMCGQLNQQSFSYAMDFLNKRAIAQEKRFFLSVGERVTALLEDVGEHVEEYFSVPSSEEGINPVVQNLLIRIEELNEERNLDHFFLIFNNHESGASYSPTHTVLLPLDRNWLENLMQREWPTNQIPTFTMDIDTLFSALIRVYLYISIYRALTESLASENASRLASMQGAEKNIEETLDLFQQDFRRQRQMSITEELLDIVSGFEALEENR